MRTAFAQRLVVWMLPVVVLCAGGAVVVYAYWEKQTTVEQAEQLMNVHLESVASLVEEGAHQAAAATSLMYELTEEDLLKAADLFAAMDPDHLQKLDVVVEEEWRVLLVRRAGQAPVGFWGPVAEASRQALEGHMSRAEPGYLVDDGPVRENELLCLREQTEQSEVIVCTGAEKLAELRRETGIGPLMNGLIQGDIRYVALQDAQGLLAVAPSPEPLSRWEDDPALGQALADEGSGRVSRAREVRGQEIFEGLIPFEMVDGSHVLLRVGVDAARLAAIRADSEEKFVLTAILAAGIVLLVVFFAGLYARWQIRQEATQRILAQKEAQQRHWEMIGQMAATVAHEIRNPLNTIGIISQRLMGEFSVPDGERAQFDEMIALLGSEASRVERVVRGFLDLGRPLELQKERFEAKVLIEEAVGPLRIRAESQGKRIEIDNRYNGEIMVDRARFQQVVANLVDNGLDAVAAGGEVRIETSARQGGWALAVEDNGPGMDIARQKEIMEPFVSFKSSGIGLGLPLVKRLVEAHGGSIELTSAPAKGTKVIVLLPGAEPK